MIKFGYKLNNKNRSLFIKYFKSMRISIVKSQISILSYYTFIPIFFLDVPIYHSIILSSINSFTQISLSKSCEKQSVEDPTTKESFKFKTRILDPEMNSGERKKKKKKLFETIKRKCHRIISQVQGSVTGQSAPEFFHESECQQTRPKSRRRAAWCLATGDKQLTFTSFLDKPG